MNTLPSTTFANFAYGLKPSVVRRRHGFHKFKGLPTTALLVDVVTLFLGSAVARYDVIGWQRILDGKSNGYRILFEETWERFLATGLDLLLAALENPTLDFDTRLCPSQPSPYSHDDHARFGTDPNVV